MIVQCGVVSDIVRIIIRLCQSVQQRFGWWSWFKKGQLGYVDVLDIHVDFDEIALGFFDKD